ncbi:hypothetical protein HK101_010550 [Irineochytrium annulatum]|nr:hypothetical protein HK101_010550 [Irineochytrium annulatum]
MSATDEEKLEILRKFILDSPPGEINDVFNDVRVLLENDDLLHNGASGAYQQYNTENFLHVTLPGQKHQVLLCAHGQLEDGRYVDPASAQSFAFDHIRQAVSDVEPYELNAEAEPFRSALEAEAANYVDDHYPNGASSVFSADDGSLYIVIVDNKYNSNNFWLVVATLPAF